MNYCIRDSVQPKTVQGKVQGKDVELYAPSHGDVIVKQKHGMVKEVISHIDRHLFHGNGSGFQGLGQLVSFDNWINVKGRELSMVDVNEAVKRINKKGYGFVTDLYLPTREYSRWRELGLLDRHGRVEIDEVQQFVERSGDEPSLTKSSRIQVKYSEHLTDTAFIGQMTPDVLTYRQLYPCFSAYFGGDEKSKYEHRRKARILVGLQGFLVVFAPKKWAMIRNFEVK